MSNAIITVECLSKSYLVGHLAGKREKYTALRDVISRQARNMVRRTVDLARGRQLLQGDEVEEFWALRDVSFEVQPGEVLGIVGRNGAGKSTLLKILSRITEPTRGRVILRGRVASLLEVGTGFHPELTGRENILLNATMLGMTRAEIRRKFDEIVAFSEVERFLDTPVKRYSSGMYVRLAFAVAAHLEPEILVVDEVLAVGDADFQKKCLGKMQDVASKQGRTVLFVSHNMHAVENLCQRVLLLDKGGIAGLYDDVRQGTLAYLGFGQKSQGSTRWVNSGAECQNDYFVPASLEVTAPDAASEGGFSHASPVVITLTGEIVQTDPCLSVGVAIYSEDGRMLFWSFTNDEEEQNWPRLATGAIRLRTVIPAHLLNEGKYRVEFAAHVLGRLWLHEPLAGAPVSVTFSIVGRVTKSPLWNQSRPGVIAPVLAWEQY